ncbi:hypothetical protein Noda2021_12120 [Candidatus Dependentiae bacterium Noda2021]|nr:hypothetical protein Noda2021_12120 [Candidatus Dependentiae bacterium Noda2021]
MRRILLIALFWHSIAAPAEFTTFFKKTLVACFTVTKKILNNDKHTNYAIASAAILAGASSLFYSIKKVIARVSFIKEKPKKQTPTITITTSPASQLKPLNKRHSWSILIASSENTPLSSPLPSRNHSRKNSGIFAKALDGEQSSSLSSIPEAHDEDIQLYGSKINDDPLSEDQIAELQRIANQTPKNERLKRMPERSYQDIYESELSEMTKKYKKMKKSAAPKVKETKIGIWWLQWEREKGGDDPIERLVLTFNGEEVDISQSNL